MAVRRHVDTDTLTLVRASAAAFATGAALRAAGAPAALVAGVAVFAGTLAAAAVVSHARTRVRRSNGLASDAAVVLGAAGLFAATTPGESRASAIAGCALALAAGLAALAFAVRRGTRRSVALLTTGGAALVGASAALIAPSGRAVTAVPLATAGVVAMVVALRWRRAAARLAPVALCALGVVVPAAAYAAGADVPLGGAAAFAAVVVGLVVRRTRRRAAAEASFADDLAAEEERTDDLFHALVAHSTDVITLIDANGYILYQSLSAAALLGTDPEAVKGRTVETLVHDEDRAVLLNLLDPQRLLVTGTVALELRLMRADGTWCVTETTISNQLANRSVRGLVLTSRDIGERKDLEEQLRVRAFCDTLTGLGNRALFRDRLEHAVARVRRYRTGLALMFIDLDGFKLVNDTLGHDVGDRLLVEVAKRLLENVRATDTVARMGGDEFAVILENPDDVRGAMQVGARVLASLQTPIVVDGMPLRVSCSIGLDSTGGPRASSADELLRNADLAMYRAKAQGKNQVAMFESGMRDAALTRVRLEKELRLAIDNDELVLHYQPVVDLASGRLTGVEALVRWQHPERGLVPPSEFVTVAEESGLIVELGRWALMRACEEMAALSNRLGVHDFWVSVNVATRQLLQPGLVQSVRAALNRSNLGADRLVLEITEGALLNDPRACSSLLHQLRALGVRLAIDDFGTGYSSLSRLRSFAVDKLKIDRSFIQEITHAHDRAPIVAAVMAMAHSLGLTAVAEGVETEDQLACLHAHGCEEVQGYLFSRPVIVEELVPFLTAKDSLLLSRGISFRPPSHDSPFSQLVREAAGPAGSHPDLTRQLLGELARQLGASTAFLARPAAKGDREVVGLTSLHTPIEIPEGLAYKAGETGTFRVLVGDEVPHELSSRGIGSLTLVPAFGGESAAEVILAVADRNQGPLPEQHIVLMELLTRVLAEGGAVEAMGAALVTA
ncbi:MAG TPA: bifunctional diguanylate cyclase/phosphodiesterase [Acidimicrobiales bacterium]